MAKIGYKGQGPAYTIRPKQEVEEPFLAFRNIFPEILFHTIFWAAESSL